MATNRDKSGAGFETDCVAGSKTDPGAATAQTPTIAIIANERSASALFLLFISFIESPFQKPLQVQSLDILIRV